MCVLWPREIGAGFMLPIIGATKCHVIGFEGPGWHGENDKAMGGNIVSGDWCVICVWVAHLLRRDVVWHDTVVPIADGNYFCL